jgi:glycosyltransferase involved in cell wall biosynthesis
MNNPFVTVCISTYNRSDILPQAISKIINQSYSNIQIIIVNDFSEDKTEEVITKFQQEDNRIEYFKHKTNLGLASARNTAIKNAKGKYFTFIDDDDDWDSTFIEKFVSLAKKYNDEWCFCCGTRRNDEYGRLIHSIPSMEGPLLDYIKQGYTPPVAAQFYFTSQLRAVNGYNEQIKTGVDHDLWLKLAFHGYYIKTLSEDLAFPNRNRKISRMTNTYYSRINGLKKSLELWKKDIINNIDYSFYVKFYNAYMQREKTKFIRISLMNGNFIKAYRINKKSGSRLSIKIMLKIIIKIMLQKLNIKLKNEKWISVGPSLNIH